jgi:hypothetical protein
MKSISSAVLFSFALVGGVAAVSASPSAPPDAAADLVGAWDSFDAVTGDVVATQTFAADGTYEYLDVATGGVGEGQYQVVGDDLVMSASADGIDYSSTTPFRLVAQGDRLVWLAFTAAPGVVGEVGQWSTQDSYEEKDASGAVVYSEATQYDLTLNADGTASLAFTALADGSAPVAYEGTYTLTGEIVELTLVDPADPTNPAVLQLYFVDGVIGGDVMTRS